jgi:RNA polymerase sigma-70 factor (ECF subfamily)
MRTDEQFTQFYREQLPLITRYLMRRSEPAAVEDLCSEVFEIAWNRRGNAPEGFELPWLYRIAGHVVSNHRRKIARENSFLAALKEPNSAPSAESLAVADLALSEAWKQLSSSDRSVLALIAFEGLGIAEAALALGISNNTASVRLHRARAHLSELLEFEE